MERNTRNQVILDALDQRRKAIDAHKQGNIPTRDYHLRTAVRLFMSVKAVEMANECDRFIETPSK